MTRARLVVGNWKMNPATVGDAVGLARAVLSAPRRGTGVGVAPPAVALAAVSDVVRGSGVAVWAQDVHWEGSGAYTGQTAASMLAGLVTGSIVGHSEVRRDQGDDEARVARKLARAVGSGLAAILCVGESEAQYVAGESRAVVERQIAEDLALLPDDGRERLVIAYEPIWAIGTGRAADGAHASAQAAAIRAALGQAGLDAERVLVLYGGSVSAKNAAEFARAEGIDGALVGGASLRADEFAAIVAAFEP